MRAAFRRTLLASGLAAGILIPALAHSGVTARPMRIALVSSSAQMKASNVQCALRIPVTAVLDRLGFAARLSESEVARLRMDPEIYEVRLDPGSWVARIHSDDPVIVNAKTNELERRLGFVSDHRYNSRRLRGFAAVLGWSQVDRLSADPDVTLNPDPTVYIAFYVSGVDVDARTDELERNYGFTARFRFRGLGGFSAQLGKAQLGGIAGEPDIEFIGSAALGPIEPLGAQCLAPSPRIRRQLRAAFVRAHPALAGERLRGPVRVRVGVNMPSQLDFGGSTATYALATFSHPRLAAETQPELFSFVGRGRWRDRGHTHGVVCPDSISGKPIPPDVLRTAWFVAPLADRPNCYPTR